MNYREIPPCPELAEHIECFWMLDGGAPSAGDLPQRILPDGCMEIILNFAEPFAERRNGGFVRQPRQFIVGQMGRPIEITPTGPVSLLGIRFQPAGAYPFLSIPMHEVTGRLETLESVSNSLSAAARAASEFTSAMPRVRIVERALLNCFDHSKASDRNVAGAMHLLLQSDGCISVAQLTSATGVSRRQLERKFLDRVGISPKLLSRILRFQKVFRAVEQDESNWAAAAVDCGYFDQSHLIRDFRQFAGDCPSALTIPQDSLTEVFMRKNRLSHFSKTQ